MWGEKVILLYCLKECNLVQLLCKASSENKKQNYYMIQQSHSWAHTKLYNSRRFMYPYVHSSTIHNSQNMVTTETSINRGMNKEVVYIHNEIPHNHKKECSKAICSNMDATRDYHTKWSKSERERQIPYIITHMWNLKYSTNEPIYKTETDSQT